MASFWDTYLNGDLQRAVDPGDPSMPYGPPLWSTPEQSPTDMRNADPPPGETDRGYLRDFIARLGADAYQNLDFGPVLRVAGPVQSAAAVPSYMLLPCLTGSAPCGGGGPGGFGGGGGGGRSIFRGGGSSPNNLRPRPGEKELSFRDSLSNPYPMEKQPVFRPGKEYREFDPSRLPPGSVTYDNVPPGHVSVQPLPLQDLKNAIIGGGKFPK